MVVDDNHAIHLDYRKVLGGKEMGSISILASAAALFGEQPKPNHSPESSFQLDSAFQGTDALELVRKSIAQGHPYALAFMDVRMPPGLDGVETTAKIWEIDPDIQVVICTAYSDYSWEKISEKLGQSDRLVILKKPFEPIEVMQLAAGLTKKWKLLREAKGKTAHE